MRTMTVAGKPAYFLAAAEPVPDELREAAQRHECWLVIERGTLNVALESAGRRVCARLENSVAAGASTTDGER